jgi:hypothetical protein
MGVFAAGIVSAPQARPTSVRQAALFGRAALIVVALSTVLASPAADANPAVCIAEKQAITADVAGYGSFDCRVPNSTVGHSVQSVRFSGGTMRLTVRMQSRYEGSHVLSASVNVGSLGSVEAKPPQGFCTQPPPLVVLTCKSGPCFSISGASTAPASPSRVPLFGIAIRDTGARNRVVSAFDRIIHGSCTP